MVAQVKCISPYASGVLWSVWGHCFVVVCTILAHAGQGPGLGEYPSGTSSTSEYYCVLVCNSPGQARRAYVSVLVLRLPDEVQVKESAPEAPTVRPGTSAN